GKDIQNPSKGGLSAELEIQRAILNVVKDAKPAAHDELRVPEHIPGKAGTRGEVVSIGKDQRIIRRSRVAGIQNVRRGIREDLGLSAREETQDVVVDVPLRSVVFVPQPQVQGQPGKNFPGVLAVKTERTSADPVS